MQANSAHALVLDGVVRGLLESSGLPVVAEVSAGVFPDEFSAGAFYVSAFVSDDLARDQVAVNVGTVLKSHLLVSFGEIEGRSADELSERLSTFVHGGLRQLRGRLLELADTLGQVIDRAALAAADPRTVVALPCSKCGGFGTVLVRRDGRHVAPGGCLGGRDVVGASYVPCHCAAGEALRRELAEPEKREPLIRQELDAVSVEPSDATP